MKEEKSVNQQTVSLLSEKRISHLSVKTMELQHEEKTFQVQVPRL